MTFRLALRDDISAVATEDIFKGNVCSMDYENSIITPQDIPENVSVASGCGIFDYNETNQKEVKHKMETKSRYEVISELEEKKRDLIREKNGFADQIIEKEKSITILKRSKEDTIVVLDRKIKDEEEELANFNKTVDERKETIEELIKSVNDSLGRFGKLAEKGK